MSEGVPAPQGQGIPTQTDRLGPDAGVADPAPPARTDAGASTTDAGPGPQAGPDGGTVPPDGGGAPPVDAGSEPPGCQGGPSNCPLNCIDPTAWPIEWRQFEDEVLTAVNERRAAGASCGGSPQGSSPPLQMDPQLREAARCHSLDMGAQDYFDHTGLDGSGPDDRIERAGYRPRTWGENIAAGQRSPASVVDSWMGSPGHCRNIMSGSFAEIGVGYAFVDSSQYGHLWTQTFGTPR